MSLARIDYRSEALGRDTSMDVVIPDTPGPWPILFLLHGLTGAYSSWLRNHQVERLVGARPVLVVMPDAGRSFYCNEPWESGIRYEDHIWQDTLAFCERTFPVLPSRTHRAVVGLSMGGYGALLMGLRHPDLFCAAGSVSGSTYFSHEPTERHAHDDVGRLARALPDDNDVFLLAEQRAACGETPALRISCGTEDFLWGTNLAFHRHLSALGTEHTWVAHPGQHDHGTWDIQVPAAVDFCFKHILPVETR